MHAELESERIARRTAEAEATKAKAEAARLEEEAKAKDAQNAELLRLLSSKKCRKGRKRNGFTAHVQENKVGRQASTTSRHVNKIPGRKGRQARWAPCHGHLIKILPIYVWPCGCLPFTLSRHQLPIALGSRHCGSSTVSTA